MVPSQSTIINEEDTSCDTGGFECSHPIESGQTVTGNFGDLPDPDTDYYAFVAQTGKEVTIGRTGTVLHEELRKVLSGSSLATA